MPRVKRGLGHLKKRRSLMKRVKGFRGGLRKLQKQAKTADTRAGMHAYRDRRVKKRLFRRLWQVRINAAIRNYDMSYSAFMGKLKEKQVGLNRKMLSEVAASKPEVFKKIIEFVK
ncbi:50S ribosomal protein L20 [Patescibacteria group bacterium]|nr:50S ribosomal protein L20 [Patescibacteria group bacterium]MBU1721871.1 50S ribosomal protein L20 [Patescibacteria group bacterium]MBU1901329.1 50S ribosomal protein L20 [Patescibacteria group bacterium]